MEKSGTTCAKEKTGAERSRRDRDLQGVKSADRSGEHACDASHKLNERNGFEPVCAPGLALQIRVSPAKLRDGDTTRNQRKILRQNSRQRLEPIRVDRGYLIVLNLLVLNLQNVPNRPVCSFGRAQFHF